MIRKHISKVELTEIKNGRVATAEEVEHLQKCQGCSNILNVLKDPFYRVDKQNVDTAYAIGEIHYLLPKEDVHGDENMPVLVVISGKRYMHPDLDIEMVPVMQLHDDSDTPLQKDIYTSYNDGIWSRHLIFTQKYAVPVAFLTTEAVGKLSMSTSALLKKENISSDLLIKDDAIGGIWGRELERSLELTMAPFTDDVQQRLDVQNEVIEYAKNYTSLHTDDLSLRGLAQQQAFVANRELAEQDNEQFAKVASKDSLVNLKNILEKLKNNGNDEVKEVRELELFVDATEYVNIGKRTIADRVRELLKILTK